MLQGLNSKNFDTKVNKLIVLQMEWFGFTLSVAMHPKDVDEIADIVGPGQTAHEGAV